MTKYQWDLAIVCHHWLNDWTSQMRFLSMHKSNTQTTKTHTHTLTSNRIEHIDWFWKPRFLNGTSYTSRTPIVWLRFVFSNSCTFGCCTCNTNEMAHYECEIEREREANIVWLETYDWIWFVWFHAKGITRMKHNKYTTHVLILLVTPHGNPFRNKTRQKVKRQRIIFIWLLLVYDFGMNKKKKIKIHLRRSISIWDVWDSKKKIEIERRKHGVTNITSLILC